MTRAQSQHPSSLGGGVASDHAGGTEATSLPIPLLVPAAAVTPAHCATLGLAGGYVPLAQIFSPFVDTTPSTYDQDTVHVL